MDKSIDCLSDIVPGRESWRIKVRVLRMWEVPTFLKPDQANSVEMVLIDEKGGKIHATIRRQLLYVFQKKLVEGGVYKMSYFAVAPGVGAYRTTIHPYKLIFQMKTKVERVESSLIPVHGLSLIKIQEVCAHTADYDYLVDVVGLMTGISAEREYVRDGKVTKMVVFELTDESGKVECALFGSYVDSLQKMMGGAGEGLPVVVVQFAKIKIFRERVSIQNVINTTRIWVNPPFEEAVKFREGVAIHGIEPSGVVPSLGPRVRPSIEEDFLRNHPKKNIYELNAIVEDGIYVVCAVVEGLVEGEDWWYPACRCHRSVTPDSGAYYCKGCVKHVFHMVPRYKVKLSVSDSTSDAVFVMFDGDMQMLLGEQCSNLVSAAKAENCGFYPPEIVSLKGRMMLFKVEKTASAGVMFDGSFRVKRVCVDTSIIEEFCTSVKFFSDVVGDEVSDLVEAANVAEETQPKFVSDGVDAELSELGEDPEVVEETQVEDFVANVVVTPAGHVSETSGFENVAPVLEQIMAVDPGCDALSLGDGGSVFKSPDLSGAAAAEKNVAVNKAKRNLRKAFDAVGRDKSTTSKKTKAPKLDLD